MGGRQKTFIVDGKLVRVCRYCSNEFPMSNFAIARRDSAGNVVQWAYGCKRCEVKRKQEVIDRLKAIGGDVWKAHRVKLQANQTNWRKRHPDKAKEFRDRYRARLKADPVRRARHLETRRIEHYLRQERNGKTLRCQMSNAVRAPEPHITLPLDWAVELIESMAGERPIEDVCAELGITSRAYRRMRNGEQDGITLPTAEKIALAVDLDLAEIV